MCFTDSSLVLDPRSEPWGVIGFALYQQPLWSHAVYPHKGETSPPKKASHSKGAVAEHNHNTKAPLCKGSWLRVAETEGLFLLSFCIICKSAVRVYNPPADYIGTPLCTRGAKSGVARRKCHLNTKPPPAKGAFESIVASHVRIHCVAP